MFVDFDLSLKESVEEEPDDISLVEVLLDDIDAGLGNEGHSAVENRSVEFVEVINELLFSVVGDVKSVLVFEEEFAFVLKGMKK